MTAKGRTGRERARVGLPRLHTVLVAASIASAAWFVATSAGLTPMRYEVPWAANGSALWLAVNSVLLTVAVRRIRQERYGAERRAAVRFPVEGYALMNGAPGRLLDASLTGFRVAVPAALDATRCTVTVDVGSGPVQVQCHVRLQRVQPRSVGQAETVLGLEAVPGQVAAQGALSRALFQTVSPASPPLLVPAQRQPERQQTERPRVGTQESSACVTVLPGPAVGPA